MKITINDVAEKAGVSKTTVSRILNGNYTQVNSNTKEHVLKIIKELDYRPNALAKGLKQVKTNVIGILLSNLLNPYWVKVLEGVQEVCQKNGYNLMICNSNEQAKLEEEHIRVLRLRQVDGIIVNPTTKNEKLFHSLIEENYPIVSINRKIENVSIDLVEMDNIRGAKLAISHLLNKGYQNILTFVYPPMKISPRLERIQGYKQAMEEQGINFSPKNIVVVEEKQGAARETVIKELSRVERPEAIFSTNNLMTLEIIEGIKDLGLSIPNDIALIGYDETVWSKHLSPPLTTVYQPAYKMGGLAAERLINMIESQEQLKPQITSLEPTLIIRESS